VDSEANLAYLESLPELRPGETFVFDCNPGVPCFNRCCAELTLPLSPYDVLRLRRQLQMPSEEFVATFVRLHYHEDTGFPMPMLRMLQGPGEPCPFVSQAGCTVYEDRPGACRYYPLGRGASMGRDGVVERFYLVREDHCRGFDVGTARTPAEWYADQDLAGYNRSNDRYMRLMSLVRATGRPLELKLVNMAMLCLFQLDRFRELIGNMKLFDRVEAEDRRELVMGDSLAADEAALDFGMDWLELVVFGTCPTLERKPSPRQESPS
jgi:Fe-S-cluster containining protein